jgi:hypothetical protein
VLVFHGVQAGSPGEPGSLLLSLGVGTLVGAIGALLLRLLLPAVQRGAPRQAAPATLMVVVAGLVCADLLREDAGFLATTLMGMSLANQRRIDVAQTLEFQGTLVQLLIGALFILIAASVSPSDVSAVVAPTLGLVAVMVLMLRPLAVALATWRSALAVRERAFVAWMAPRGIVAGATASAFGLELAQSGVQGADKILPISFMVIFATVCLYGLSAEPVARALGVAGARGTTVLVIGGHAFAREVGESLSRAGLRVRLWTGRREEQAAARAAGLDADHGRLIVDAVSREAELEEVTQALLLTASDDFNALAAAELRDELGHDSVHRVAPTPGRTDLLPPANEAAIVGNEELTLDAFSERLTAGGHLVDEAHSGGAVDGAAAAGSQSPLFVVTNHGALRVATPGRPLDPLEGETVIRLASAPDA